MKKLLLVTLLALGTLVVADGYSPKIEKASDYISQAQRGFKEYSSGRSRNDAAMTGAGVGGGGGYAGSIKGHRFAVDEE